LLRNGRILVSRNRRILLERIIGEAGEH
jgi:hypothetical protein